MKKSTFCISIILTVLGALLLLDSRALFEPYLIAVLFAVWCLFANRNEQFDKKCKAYRIITAASVIGAAFIALANYPLWLHPDLPDVRGVVFVRIYKLALLLIIFAGSFISCNSILKFICLNPKSFSFEKVNERNRALRFFLIPFVIITTVYVTIWLCCYYPGLMSLDSVDQLTQIFTGKYSNHQPFYHTMILSFFVRIGLALFNDMNAAVATYTLFQIIFMSATFSFIVYNMAKLQMPLWTEILSSVWFAVMPFHIMFSFTVWKDVYFGAFTALMIVFLIRLMRGIGYRWINIVCFALTGPFICLIRSNGLFSYVFVLLAILLLARKHKEIIFIMLATVAVSFVMKHTVLSDLGVTQPDTVESLSIPLQQVARVIADDGYMEESDIELLSNIIDVRAIKDNYDPDISDPIKNMIRDFGNEDFLSENMGEYGMLYLRTLIHNPVRYVEAWVDSTCGYWNSGYNYWVWFWDVEDNEYGVVRTVSSEGVLRMMDEYLWLFYNNPVFRIFTAIGLYVWIILIAFAKSVSASNRCGIIVTVPILAILLSLLISSPVYAEFRYMYALFTSLPILLSITFLNTTEDKP